MHALWMRVYLEVGNSHYSSANANGVDISNVHIQARTDGGAEVSPSYRPDASDLHRHSVPPPMLDQVQHLVIALSLHVRIWGEVR